MKTGNMLGEIVQVKHFNSLPHELGCKDLEIIFKHAGAYGRVVELPKKKFLRVQLCANTKKVTIVLRKEYFSFYVFSIVYLDKSCRFEVEHLEKRAFSKDDQWKSFTRDCFTSPNIIWAIEKKNQSENEIVAFCMLEQALYSESATIVKLCVDPSLRRLGLARRLLKAVLQTVPDTSDVFLHCREDNHAAKSLYKSFQFHRHRPLPGYYSQGRQDGVVLVRRSTSSEIFYSLPKK